VPEYSLIPSLSMSSDHSAILSLGSYAPRINVMLRGAVPTVGLAFNVHVGAVLSSCPLSLIHPCISPGTKMHIMIMGAVFILIVFLDDSISVNAL
jgi:hypothetical protein